MKRIEIQMFSFDYKTNKSYLHGHRKGITKRVYEKEFLGDDDKYYVQNGEKIWLTTNELYMFHKNKNEKVNIDSQIQIIRKQFMDKEFDDLGSLKDYCKKYGKYSISIVDKKKSNICLIIKANQKIADELYCSIPLSEIIRNNNISLHDIKKYRVLKISGNDGLSYIRVSQLINVDGDTMISLHENVEKVKDIPGSVNIIFQAKDIKDMPLPTININIEDYIAL